MISVVIPTLNESSRLPGLLSFLGNCDLEHEVIVSDGGSRDDTVAIAKASGALVVAAETGRGSQLTAGVRCARGETLLFLHADSEPNPGCLAAIEKVLKDCPNVIGGNFRVEYNDNSFYCRIVEALCAGLRSFGMYYGDSGIFVRRSVYEAIGGFKPLAIMEDVDFVRRLEKYGKTCCISKVTLRTSTRRFKRKTPAELLFLWIRMHVLFALGVSDANLAALYDAQATEAGNEGAGRV